jgi:hypothetical protein
LVPLRAGFKTNPTPYSNTKTGSAPNQVFGKGFNAGIGVIMDFLAFDVSYERNSYTIITETLSSKTENISAFNHISVSMIVYISRF